MGGMERMMAEDELKRVENFENEEKLVKEEITASAQSKGMFRDPLHAALTRKRVEQGGLFGLDGSGSEDEVKTLVNKGVSQSLRHLKLSFPVFKEGSDTMEWLRDCKEYFTIYEVEDKRRPAIAAMHLTGVPRSWYKSFMIGQEGVTWNKFCQAFISRFGELDTGLVFDRFKRLQQSTTVEAYYDEFEKCRGQLLNKIPSLTNEYFMENFIGGLQTEIRGMIRLLEPSSLEQALKLARHYEQSITPQQKKTSGETGNYNSGPTKQTSAKIYPSTFSSTTPATGKQSILTTEKEIEGISAKPRPSLMLREKKKGDRRGCAFIVMTNSLRATSVKSHKTF